MIDLFRAELLKLRTTRMIYGLLLGLLAIVALANIVGVLASQERDLIGEDNQAAFFGVAALGIVFVLLLGVMLMAGEFRHGTITQTLLITPNRWKVLAVKLLAGATLGLAFGVIAEAFSFVTAVPLLWLRGIELEIGDQVVELVLGTLLGTTLTAMLGVAVGTVIRNQIAAVIVVFASLLIVENIATGLLDLRWPEAPKYLPGHAINAVIDPGSGLLSRWGGLAVVCAYVSVLALVGGRFVLSRDVNSIQA